MRLQLLILLGMVSFLRLAGIICGLWYGPLLYAIITLGGLYMALDLLVLYLVYAADEGMPPTENERVFKLIWVVCNLVGALVLVGGVVLLVLKLGFGGMVHEEVHIVLFAIVVALIPLLIVTTFLLMASVGKGTSAPAGPAYHRTIEY